MSHRLALVPIYLERMIASLLPRQKLRGVKHGDGFWMRTSTTTFETSDELDILAEMLAREVKQYGWPGGSFKVYVQAAGSCGTADPCSVGATIGVKKRNGLMKKVYWGSNMRVKRYRPDNRAKRELEKLHG